MQIILVPLQAIIAQHGFPIIEWALWIRVCIADWTVESTIIASNDTYYVVSLCSDIDGAYSVFLRLQSYLHLC